MSNEVSPLQAREASDRATAASAKVAISSRWTGTYLAVFALAFAAATMIIGLVQPPSLGMIIFGALWVTVTFVMVRWAISNASPARAPAGVCLRTGCSAQGCSPRCC